MLRLVPALLLVISTRTISPIPAKQIWYLAIAAGEFPWVWMSGTIILLIPVFCAENITKARSWIASCR